MAVTSGSGLDLNADVSSAEEEMVVRRREEEEQEEEEEEAEEEGEAELANAKKKGRRSKEPRVRVVGGRIYDSKNGKTCHQCRQKTMDFMAMCKNMRGNKQCTLGFCHKCLLNRYGEKAEEVSSLDKWQCPKCKGICNCSFCMKRRGQKPTGQLFHTAKENGFSSVSEMLLVKSPESFIHDKAAKNLSVFPMKLDSSKEPIFVSPRNSGKENSFDVKSHMDLHPKGLAPKSSDKKCKKTKRQELKDVGNGNNDDAGSRDCGWKKLRIAEGVSETEEIENGKGESLLTDKKKSKMQSEPASKQEVKTECLDVSEKQAKMNGKTEGNLFKKKKHKAQISKNGDKQCKKTKRQELKDIGNGNKDDAGSGDCGWKKLRIAEGVSENEVMESGKGESHLIDKKKSKIQSEPASKQEVKTECLEASEEQAKMKIKTEGNLFKKKKHKAQVSGSVSVSLPKNGERAAANCKVSKVHKGAHSEASGGANFDNGGLSDGVEDDNIRKAAKQLCNLKNSTADLSNKQIQVEISLPQGICLATVAGIELPPEDIGYALQFLEFCASFGKFLGLKKGHAEAVIREMTKVRRGCQSHFSLVAQFHIQLLTLIQKDAGEKSPSLSATNGKTSWLQALGKCVSKCQFVSKEFSSSCFDGGNEGYNELSILKKLKLLNFLCDEALNTNELRNWMDDQNSKFIQQTKEAKAKVLAAKDKEKHLKQQMQNEVAKAIIARNGAPLSISEHEALVSQIKKEAAQAHAEMLEAMGMVPKNRQRSDVVRTNPVTLDVDGRVFWRLKGYKSELDILLQDIGSRDSVTLQEKWYAYDAGQKQKIEKYISSLRIKRHRVQETAETLPVGNGETNLLHAPNQEEISGTCILQE